MTKAVKAGKGWAALGGERTGGDPPPGRDVSLTASRGELIEVMANEAGKTIAEGDPEVSEAIDFANYYAALAPELDRVPGARLHARRH